MRKRWICVCAAAALLCAEPALAADDAALSRELLAAISAQGFSCGKVAKIRTQAERDYLVACQDGSHYQVTANAQGVLEPHPLGQKIH